MIKTNLKTIICCCYSLLFYLNHKINDSKIIKLNYSIYKELKKSTLISNSNTHITTVTNYAGARKKESPELMDNISGLIYTICYLMQWLGVHSDLSNYIKGKDRFVVEYSFCF